MYLRFAGTELDPRTGRAEGLLTIVYDLRDSGELNTADDTQLQEHLHWIQTTVPIPTRFSRGRHVNHKETHGLSWAKCEARELVRHLYALADIAGRYDRTIEAIRSERPGYVVYEDAWQIVAEPFNGESA
jgi:hypothetical protein